MAGRSRGTRKKQMNRRRKGLLSVAIPWVRRFGIVLALFVGVLWAGAWFFLSEADSRLARWGQQSVINLSAGMGFTVQDVFIEGREYSDPAILKALLNIEKGDPLFSVSPKEAKALVERISWVRRAHVERRLPGTLYIRIEERKPLALWQKDKRLYLLDHEGEVITTENMERFKDLVIVIGPDAPQHAPAFLRDIAAEPLVYGRAVSATRIGGRRWDVRLKGGTVIKLPESDVGLALRRLAKAQEEDQVLDKDLESIDLRVPDRMIIRIRPGQVQDYRAGFKAEDNI